MRIACLVYIVQLIIRPLKVIPPIQTYWFRMGLTAEIDRSPYPKILALFSVISIIHEIMHRELVFHKDTLKSGD